MGFRQALYDLATDKAQGAGASLAKFLLKLASYVYSAAVSLAMSVARRRQVRLDCRVISVGNITVGGTGKTVLVQYVARFLRKQGRKVAVLTRGYTPGQGRCCRAPADEPRMMQQNLGDTPVLIDPDRIRSARAAIRDFGVDTVLLDDGLQQWRIRKDLEIVTIDALDPFGNRQLLPRGILRQPLGTLSAADIFVITHADHDPSALAELHRQLEGFNPRALRFEAAHVCEGFYLLGDPAERWDIAQLRAEPVGLFCGIGNPVSFYRTVESLGIRVGFFEAFADHYCLQSEDLGRLAHQARERAITTLVTTEKDAVRIPRQALQGFECRILVMPVSLKILHDEQRFLDRLLGGADS